MTGLSSSNGAHSLPGACLDSAEDVAHQDQPVLLPADPANEGEPLAARRHVVLAMRTPAGLVRVGEQHARRADGKCARDHNGSEPPPTVYGRTSPVFIDRGNGLAFYVPA